MNVLLVDDDADGREAVRRYFEKAGHDVECVPNGRQAIVALGRRNVDAVILDVMMPEMGGVGFLEVIRCYLSWAELPVVMLTAYPNGPHVKRAMELGVKKIFVKSDYDLADLVTYVEGIAPPLMDIGDLPGDAPAAGFGN